jgi:hypothetical protein
MTMASPPSMLRRLRFQGRMITDRYPASYFPLAHATRRDKPELIVGPQTELVIEASPRSGNSFAVVAFELAQRPRRVRIAHHSHAPAQVARAVKLGAPTIVIVREPADACLSLAVRERGITVRQSLAAWIGFYERIVPLRSGVVVAGFEAVTRDLGSVIGAVNHRFGTDFARFVHSPQAEARVFELLEHYDREDRGLGGESTVARPSEARAAMKEAMRAELDAPSLARMRIRAESLHAELLAPSQGL